MKWLRGREGGRGRREGKERGEGEREGGRRRTGVAHRVNELTHRRGNYKKFYTCGVNKRGLYTIDLEGIFSQNFRNKNQIYDHLVEVLSHVRKGAPKWSSQSGSTVGTNSLLQMQPHNVSV